MTAPVPVPCSAAGLVPSLSPSPCSGASFATFPFSTRRLSYGGSVFQVGHPAQEGDVPETICHPLPFGESTSYWSGSRTVLGFIRLPAALADFFNVLPMNAPLFPPPPPNYFLSTPLYMRRRANGSFPTRAFQIPQVSISLGPPLICEIDRPMQNSWSLPVQNPFRFVSKQLNFS